MDVRPLRDLGLGSVIPTVFMPLLLLVTHSYALKYSASFRAIEALLYTKRQRPSRAAAMTTAVQAAVAAADGLP